MKCMDYLYECYNDSLSGKYKYGSWIIGHICGLIMMISSIIYGVNEIETIFNNGILETIFGYMSLIIFVILVTVITEFIIHLLYGLIADNIYTLVRSIEMKKYMKEKEAELEAKKNKG